MRSVVPTRHPIYYFNASSHIFQVENTLYKLCSSILSASSNVFRDMFSTMENSRQPEVDGMCDDKPIHLNGISRETFELFLEFTFGRMHTGSHSIDELSKFLPKLINLAIKYHIRSIFPYAFQQLAETPITELTHAHQELMGDKAALDSHRRIVAAEEPKILMHSNECQDPTGLQQGLARNLVEWNPQPYDDAVKRFKELQFGRVSEGCKDLMFKILDQGAAFKHAEQFVSETCSFLVEKLYKYYTAVVRVSNCLKESRDHNYHGGNFKLSFESNENAPALDWRKRAVRECGTSWLKRAPLWID
ncbi:hypothetical protein DFJ58DRAFT_840993 [Suillus subalutaceus]|uniref:uncharacterized protein n=1 Tax=Suillus subalutaceus TaxID=48586 RepID=UPI001B86FE5D|nr:uncharacterized protein DFJ58DRAFT_840993 [Suillus subalutaceus]KAG1855692.1 hypothetical protein DFJ58DRAFT_840993 [Suillus subalutaceus]